MAEVLLNGFKTPPLHKYQTFPKEKCLTWANVCHLKTMNFLRKVGSFKIVILYLYKDKE